MLGNAVYNFFNSQQDYTVSTTNTRWGTEEFVNELTSSDAEYVINCIGIIPQKKLDVSLYKKINIDLPVFLETLNKKIIHPSTDCEFSGNIPNTYAYKKTDIRDATDDYGKSKADISKLIAEGFKNTKIIRTSIIGHEMATNLSLLDWFLHTEGNANGYTNHYWNGITTLEWAKLCKDLIENWDSHSKLTQYGTSGIRSKYDLLEDIKNVYEKDISVTPFEAATSANKCLESDREIKPIREQLIELRKFYNK